MSAVHRLLALTTVVVTATVGIAVGFDRRPASAQDDATTPTETVVVSTKAIEPFVFVDPDGGSPADQLDGFSIELWDEAASRLGLATDWQIRETVSDILDDVQNGEADVAIAGISMTPSREAVLDFSHPYFDSGLQVVTVAGDDGGTVGTLWRLVTQADFLLPIGVLVVLIALISHAVWWVERRDNEGFPDDYRQGIAEAVWWSTVSVVTGGEAVKDIRRPLSRILAVGWMVVGLFLLAYVTARATSVLTVQQLESDIAGLEDLGGRSVGTVEATAAAGFLDQQFLRYDGYRDIDAALDALASGRVEAVVYDAPVLAHLVATERPDLEIVGARFAPDPYGIALPSGSPLREPLNEVLLAMSRDGTTDDLFEKWFDQTR